MEITDKIKQLKLEQLETIIKARRAVPLAEFLSVNGKARNACIQRHHGWQDQLLKYTNAAAEACVRVKLGNAISMAAIVTAFESMGLGVIAKVDLDLEEYDTIISPVISAFPELIILKQDWTPVPLERNAKWSPRVQYELPPQETRTQATMPKKGRPYRRTEDLEAAVADVIDTADLMAALKPKKVESKLTSSDAIQAMMNALKPKVVAVPIEGTFEITAEITETTEEIEVSRIENAVEQLQAVTPEDLGIKPKFLHLQPSTVEGEGFRFIDFETAIYWGPPFKTAIDGIIWAAKEGIKIK